MSKILIDNLSLKLKLELLGFIKNVPVLANRRICCHVGKLDFGHATILEWLGNHSNYLVIIENLQKMSKCYRQYKDFQVRKL